MAMTQSDELDAVAELRAQVRSGPELAKAERVLTAAFSAGPVASSRAPRRASGRAPRQRLIVAGIGVTVVSVAAAALIVVPSLTRAPGSGPISAHQGGASAQAMPSVGIARTEAQLVAYSTKVAQAQHPLPGPHEWSYMKTLLRIGGHGTETWVRLDRSKSATIWRGKMWTTSDRGIGIASWPTWTYRYLESLPTNPAKLKAVIVTNNSTPPDSRIMDPGDQGIFEAIEYLMENTVLPPQLLATFYKILVGLPSVHFDPSATDFLGRHGIGLSMTIEGWDRTELVINPRTYQLLGFQDVVAANKTIVGTDVTRHYRKGEGLGHWALITSGIVQHSGQRPG